MQPQSAHALTPAHLDIVDGHPWPTFRLRPVRQEERGLDAALEALGRPGAWRVWIRRRLDLSICPAEVISGVCARCGRRPCAHERVVERVEQAATTDVTVRARLARLGTLAQMTTAEHVPFGVLRRSAGGSLLAAEVYLGGSSAHEPGEVALALAQEGDGWCWPYALEDSEPCLWCGRSDCWGRSRAVSAARIAEPLFPWLRRSALPQIGLDGAVPSARFQYGSYELWLGLIGFGTPVRSWSLALASKGERVVIEARRAFSDECALCAGPCLHERIRRQIGEALHQGALAPLA